MHGLPTLTLVRAARLERRSKQLLPEASRPFRVIGRKLDQEWRRCHDSDATENGRGSFRGSRVLVGPTSNPDDPRLWTAAVYLPREVFFGRLVLAGAFFSVWANDFGRFFPATSAPSADRVNRNRVTLPPDPLAQTSAASDSTGSVSDPPTRILVLRLDSRRRMS